MMGGYTRVVPDEDRLFKTKTQFEDELAVYMAGHVAEDDGLRGAVDRRRERHRARHRAGAPHGHRVRHERHAGTAGLRQEGRARLPGPRDQRAAQLQRRGRVPDRPGDPGADRRGPRAGAGDRRRSTSTSCEAIADLLLEKETIEGEELEALFETPRPRPDLVGPPSGRPGRGFVPGTPAAEQPAARSERDLPPSPGQLRPQPAD